MTVENTQNAPNRTGSGALLAGGLAAVLASTCCLGPLVLVAFRFEWRVDRKSDATRTVPAVFHRWCPGLSVFCVAAHFSNGTRLPAR
jgi:hypothetical protein